MTGIFQAAAGKANPPNGGDNAAMSPGLAYAASAYFLWGLFPLYFHALEQVDAFELVVHRSLWSFVFIWAVLAAAHQLVIRLFNIVDPQAAQLITFFCLFAAGSWVFHGLLFVANASFNNLGFPIAATLSNWGKATLGTIPFAMVGAKYWGAEGALAVQGLGAVIFGVFGVWWAYRSLRWLKVPGQT